MQRKISPNLSIHTFVQSASATKKGLIKTKDVKLIYGYTSNEETEIRKEENDEIGGLKSKHMTYTRRYSHGRKENFEQVLKAKQKIQKRVTSNKVIIFSFIIKTIHLIIIAG